jgi:hypothetical protein
MDHFVDARFAGNQILIEAKSSRERGCRHFRKLNLLRSVLKPATFHASALMAATPIACGFGRFLPWQARAVLAIAAVAAIFFVAITLSPLASGFADAPDRGASDIELYRAEVARIQRGESYYDAASTELTARGYPTRSVFNWRMPLPVWLLGKLPGPAVGRVLLSILALAGIVVGSQLMARECGLRHGVICGLWLIGGLLPCFLDKLYVMHELWAGAFILLSVLAYGMKRPGWGAALAIAPLAIRELAAPYCVLCFVFAVVERRRKEVWFWLIAGVIYTIAFGLHAMQVVPRIAPDARAHNDGWLCFGGAAFVISIVQMNGFLLLLPQWVSGVVLAAAMLGFAGWNSAAGRRAGFAASLYLGLFAVIGQPFNQYWGSLIAPLVCLGIAAAPDALATLWRCARRSSAVTVILSCGGTQQAPSIAASTPR